MEDHIYELKFIIGKDARGLAEVIHSALVGQGFRETDIIEDGSDRNIKVSVFLKSGPAAGKIRAKIRALGLGRMRTCQKRLFRRDWSDKWRKGLKPFKLTKDLTIVPLRYKEDRPSGDRNRIHLDMTGAFGSGTHQTTRAAAGFLEKLRGGYRDFFDIGAGTGILSLIAARYGATVIWALDNEEEAVRTAKKNFRLNAVNVDLIENVDVEKFRRKRKFDLVAANLITDVLIANRDKIVSYVRKGKYLAVSGISRENLRRFRREFDERGLKCLRVIKESQWAGILYRRA